ncbi:IS5 family transposase [Rubinisphaera margarita]|uniref:IS5 family transposase n=1 Tax=Rubinisphaera margarita TaxID=2909586 RepID=UPI001EE84C0E|nr:IS5 family transposase [Rubinisphaera margarita]MCG6154620.1 IS5 family transposase [Rubinisphaera margarita]
MFVVPVRYYPSDLTDRQWKLIRGFLRRLSKRGAPRKYDYRVIINAVFFVVKAGCQWRMLPREFPHWKAVYQLFYRWRNSGVWERIHDTLRMKVRDLDGKRPKPTAAIIDSQSVKTTHIAGDERGYDSGKKINGRKRHIVVDTLGLLLAVIVHRANEQDYNGAPLVLYSLWEKMKSIQVIFADTVYGYKGLPEFTRQTLGMAIMIVKRPVDQLKGCFEVQPKRWIVERTFAWIGLYRRNSKDYEINPEISATIIQITMFQIMLNRLDRTKL